MNVMSPISIFDVDTHYAEPPDLWTSRAPSKYRDRVFHVGINDRGAEAWFFEGREIAMIGPAVVAKDMSKKLNTCTITKHDDMADACSQAKSRLQFMNETGVGSQIIYPNVIGFGTQTMMNISDDIDLRHWHVTSYNDALLDLQQGGDGRLLPQAALPLWDIDASLKELERIRKMGLTGIVMCDNPSAFGQPKLASPVWDRFFAVCQDLDLPINFHIGSGGFEGDFMSKWWGDDKNYINPDSSVNGPISVYSQVTAFMNNAHDVLNLILGGVLNRFPKLKFVSVESGCGWIPFVIQAIEHGWNEMFSPAERATFKREPRQMFIEQIYCSYWFENANNVGAYIAEFGDTNLMFQTDFPHPTSLYPNVQEKAIETLSQHSEDTQRNVLYRNAERVYGTKVGAPMMHT